MPRPPRPDRWCKRCGAHFTVERIDRRREYCGAPACAKAPGIARFWAGVVKSEGCWEWSGRVGTHGYGVLHAGGVRETTHRFSYELHYGPIPDGMLVLHHCDNRRCVRPDHIYAGTRMDNVIDMTVRDRRNDAIGEASSSAKLTAAEVREIRDLAASRVMSKRAIGRAYGLGHTTINSLVAGKTWQHVPDHR